MLSTKMPWSINCKAEGYFVVNIRLAKEKSALKIDEKRRWSMSSLTMRNAK